MRSDHQSPERVSPEDLAAFLDGTLSAADRERVLAVMARSEESYDALLEAAALQKELSAAAPIAVPTPVLRAPARWRSPRLFVAPALAAAAVILAVWVSRRSSSEEDRLLAVVASATQSGAASRGDVTKAYTTQWNLPGWTEARGADGANAELSTIRAGVRFTELQAALASRDTTAQKTARDALLSLMANIDGGPLLSSTIERAGRQNASFDAGAVVGQLRALGDSPVWFDLGVWIEAARLASLSGRAEFFAPDGSEMAELRRIIAAADRLGVEQRRISDPIVDPLRGLATSASSVGVTGAKARIDSAFTAVSR
jgi:hypothetical protein